MKEKLKAILKHAVLALCGGWRVLSHRDGRGAATATGLMAVLGGVCFVLIGDINEFIPWNMPLILQGAIGSGIVTVLELVSGIILNLWLGLGIWDYSNMPFNLLGQICLPFTPAVGGPFHRCRGAGRLAPVLAVLEKIDLPTRYSENLRKWGGQDIDWTGRV